MKKRAIAPVLTVKVHDETSEVKSNHRMVRGPATAVSLLVEDSPMKSSLRRGKAWRRLRGFSRPDARQVDLKRLYLRSAAPGRHRCASTDLQEGLSSTKRRSRAGEECSRGAKVFEVWSGKRSKQAEREVQRLWAIVHTFVTYLKASCETSSDGRLLRRFAAATTAQLTLAAYASLAFRCGHSEAPSRLQLGCHAAARRCSALEVCPPSVARPATRLTAYAQPCLDPLYKLQGVGGEAQQGRRENETKTAAARPQHMLLLGAP